MKVAVIYGSPHQGNTFNATEIIKGELQKYGDFQFTDFFLPRDMPHFCCGCYLCFEKGEDKCPHAQYIQPIAQAIREADGLIITSPVYSLGVSGGVKALFDHFSYLFINHRPMEEAFSKVALVLSTTAGYGTGHAIKTIRRVLRFWGIRRVLTCGLGLFTKEWDEMNPTKQTHFSRILHKKAEQFH